VTADEGMRPRGRHAPPRDQRESAFTAILTDLVERVPGARCAALVDRDGETVDYGGRGSPYEMRVAAAHLRIVFDEALAQPSLHAVRSFVVRASRMSFALYSLPHGYALVLALSRGAGFRGMGRAIPVCTTRLADEAGWDGVPSPWHPLDVLLDERGTPRAIRRVRPLSVPTETPAVDARGRELVPDLANESETTVEILGRFRAALPEHERAWRARAQPPQAQDPRVQELRAHAHARGAGAEPPTNPASPARSVRPASLDFTLVRESNGYWYADEPVLSSGRPPVSRGKRRPKQIP
jgi:hypothetical protein